MTGLPNLQNLMLNTDNILPEILAMPTYRPFYYGSQPYEAAPPRPVRFKPMEHEKNYQNYNTYGMRPNKKRLSRPAA